MLRRSSAVAAATALSIVAAAAAPAPGSAAVLGRVPGPAGCVSASTPACTPAPVALSGADVAVSPDGRFVYGGRTRSDEDPRRRGQRLGVTGSRYTLAVFARDPLTGRVHALRTPAADARSDASEIAYSGDGRFLFV